MPVAHQQDPCHPHGTRNCRHQMHLLLPFGFVLQHSSRPSLSFGELRTKLFKTRPLVPQTTACCCFSRFGEPTAREKSDLLYPRCSTTLTPPNTSFRGWIIIRSQRSGCKVAYVTGSGSQIAKNLWLRPRLILNHSWCSRSRRDCSSPFLSASPYSNRGDQGKQSDAQGIWIFGSS